MKTSAHVRGDQALLPFAIEACRGGTKVTKHLHRSRVSADLNGHSSLKEPRRCPWRLSMIQEPGTSLLKFPLPRIRFTGCPRYPHYDRLPVRNGEPPADEDFLFPVI
jgi:hypothetical protein